MKILDCQGSIEVQKACLIASKVKSVQVMMKIIQTKDSFMMKVSKNEVPETKINLHRNTTSTTDEEERNSSINIISRSSKQ